MIVVISNRLSSLWSLFSGPILGLETLLITKNIGQGSVDSLLPWSQEDFIEQTKIFSGQWIQDDSYPSQIHGATIIVMGENHTSYEPHYTITTNNFWEEAAQLSQIIGIIYNGNPQNPPLTSIPHSTTTVEKAKSDQI